MAKKQKQQSKATKQKAMQSNPNETKWHIEVEQE